MSKSRKAGRQDWVVQSCPSDDFQPGATFDWYNIKETAAAGHFPTGTTFMNEKEKRIIVVVKCRGSFKTQEVKYE